MVIAVSSTAFCLARAVLSFRIVYHRAWNHVAFATYAAKMRTLLACTSPERYARHNTTCFRNKTHSLENNFEYSNAIDFDSLEIH